LILFKIYFRFCEGGELFDRIIEKKCLNEDEAKLVFLQIMQSINYLHNKKLSHRDLKPENFLLINKKNDSPIKTIDFGLSRHFNYENNKVNMHTNVGTVK
jgi:calcium-dependent protein kinase